MDFQAPLLLRQRIEKVFEHFKQIDLILSADKSIANS